MPKSSYPEENEMAFEVEIDEALGWWAALLPRRIVRKLYRVVYDEAELAIKLTWKDAD